MSLVYTDSYHTESLNSKIKRFKIICHADEVGVEILAAHFQTYNIEKLSDHKVQLVKNTCIQAEHI